MKNKIGKMFQKTKQQKKTKLWKRREKNQKIKE
jgi:hypothetical protein